VCKAKFYDGHCHLAIDVLKDMDYLGEGLQRIAEQANGQYLHINSPRIPEMSRTFHTKTMVKWERVGRVVRVTKVKGRVFERKDIP